MSRRPYLAELATDALAAAPIAECPGDPIVEEQIIRAMADRIKKEARRRALRRAALMFAAAAAFALSIGTALLHRKSPPIAIAPPPAPPLSAVESATVAGDHASLLRGGTALALNGDSPLSVGDRIVLAADGRASIRLRSGTHLSVEPGGDVSVLKQGLLQMFSLDEGSLRADVAKLGEGERFVVRTRDVEIEARGTSFRLTTGDSVSCGGRSTRVEVEAGSALVRNQGKEARVLAGEHWPADCGTKAPQPPGSARSANRSPRAAAHEIAPQPETSELKAQTRLFGDAILAKRRGDTRTAVARFEQYLAQYPDSALAEGAFVQRMTLLSTLDHARAMEAAREYLRLYPRGFARDDAAAILGGGP